MQSRFVRTMSAVVLALVLGPGLIGATDVAERTNALSHQMMCTCGCVQLLGECNHVGCPNSGPMLKTLRADVSSGMSDHAVLVAFEQEYGPTALASPLLTRFNQAAWVVPPAVLILGILGAILMLRRWRKARHRRVPVPAFPGSPDPKQIDPHQRELLARVRREAGDR